LKADIVRSQHGEQLHGVAVASMRYWSGVVV